jgi:hypothetical protein
MVRSAARARRVAADAVIAIDDDQDLRRRSSRQSAGDASPVPVRLFPSHVEPGRAK